MPAKTIPFTADNVPQTVPFSSAGIVAPTQKANQLAVDANAANDTAKQQNSPLGIAKQTVKNISTTLTGNEIGTGESLGQSAAASDVIKNVSQGDSGVKDMQIKVLHQIAADKAAGKDTSHLESAYNSIVNHGSSTGVSDILPAIDKSNAQALFESAGVGADILSGGTFGKSAAGMKSLALAKPATLLPTVVKDVAIPVAKKVAEKTTGLAAKFDTRLGGEGAENAIKKVAQNVKNKVKAVADEWAKPISTGKAGFNKSGKILAGSPDIPQFLAEQGLSPHNHIENGRYITTDSADALKQTAAKMSNDALRPSLEAADFKVAKTPVSDMTKSAISRIEKDSAMTEGDKSAAIDAVNKEGAALEKKYPDGMSLTNLHDNKITYAKNAGYSPINDPATNIRASSNRALSSTFQKAVEDKAPEDVPVSDFNKYLQKYYKSADYLDSLNSKTAPVSLGQQVVRGVAKFGGAALGGHVGGGVVSEFAGYQIAKSLEHAMENLTNPMREAFLKNIQKTNPEAYTKLQDFIGKENADRATRLALPEGAPLGSSRNPRIVAPKDTSSVKSVPATVAKPELLALPPGRTIIPAAPSVESQMRSRASEIFKRR